MALKTFFVRYRPHGVYAFLALLVMAPLLRPGFILTLDMVFTPRIRMPHTVTSSYLFYALLHGLNFVVPSEILQKILLLSILFLSGFGMHRLVGLTRNAQDGNRQYAEIGAYVGGAFYMINPFTYSRFMAGQFAVLLGYCLLPFFVCSLLKLLAQPSWRMSLMVAFWMTMIGIVSIHTLGSVAILFGVTFLLEAWRRRRSRRQLVTLLKFCAVSISIAVAASSYWLLPLLLGHGATAQAVAGFGAGDEQAFATAGGSTVGRIANVVRLQGFWAEGRGLFILPQAHMAGWGLVVLLLWLCVGVGAVSLWRRRQRFISIVLLASAVVGTLLGAGIANVALKRLLPAYGGFREPHKFVMLVALAYAFFAAAGVRAILERLERRKRRLRLSMAIGVALLLPVAITPTMFWGFGGQLQPHQYPKAWYDMNTRLGHGQNDARVLFLPWHLYMDYGFVGRIIASPAPAFFDTSILSSNQPEFGAASPTDIDPAKAVLSGRILPSAPQGMHLGAQLASLHIKYVLLDKDDDYQRYNYLGRQTDLHLITQNGSFRLYVNTAYKEKQ